MKTIQGVLKMTGKRQVTVPARAARYLELAKNAELQYWVEDDRLILAARPSVADVMAEVQRSNIRVNKRTASDKDIAQARKAYYRHRAKRFTDG